jgi:hypothetical protein
VPVARARADHPVSKGLRHHHTDREHNEYPAKQAIQQGRMALQPR